MVSHRHHYLSASHDQLLDILDGVGTLEVVQHDKQRQHQKMLTRLLARQPQRFRRSSRRLWNASLPGGMYCTIAVFLEALWRSSDCSSLSGSSRTLSA